MSEFEKSKEVVREVLDAILGAKVAVIGGFGLDAYWFLDEEPSELSAETGLPTRAVRRRGARRRPGR